MFRCKKCKKVDRFDLMFSPDYKGKKIMTKEFNSNGHIVINVDGYTFVPDLAFMNSHSVCSYCGEISQWEYYFE